MGVFSDRLSVNRSASKFPASSGAGAKMKWGTPRFAVHAMTQKTALKTIRRGSTRFRFGTIVPATRKQQIQKYRKRARGPAAS